MTQTFKDWMKHNEKQLINFYSCNHKTYLLILVSFDFHTVFSFYKNNWVFPSYYVLVVQDDQQFFYFTKFLFISTVNLGLSLMYTSQSHNGKPLGCEYIRYDGRNCHPTWKPCFQIRIFPLQCNRMPTTMKTYFSRETTKWVNNQVQGGFSIW